MVMRPRHIVATVLLSFAAASVIFLFAKESARPPAPAPEPVTDPEPAPPDTVAEQRVVAYYFHGNFRCSTCRTIEAYSHAAVTEGFTQELKSGRLVWRVVNVEEPGNEHFIRDFELTTRSLVVVKVQGETVLEWANLQDVWKLVGDRKAFLDYVQSEVRTRLGQQG